MELRLELLVALGVWLAIEGSSGRGSEQGWASASHNFTFQIS